jgi:solute carrier family 45 protein 1/2/4
MFSTFFIYSPGAGTVMVAVVGVSWALTLWAPFAFISAEVAERDAKHRERRHKHHLRRTSSAMARERPPPQEEGAGDADDEMSDDDGSKDDDEDEEIVDQAGIILGIHNVAISCPQMVSTLISSAIFKALQKPRGEPWDDSVGWVLRFGGVATLGAAFFAYRLTDKVSRTNLGVHHAV